MKGLEQEQKTHAARIEKDCNKNRKELQEEQTETATRTKRDRNKNNKGLQQEHVQQNYERKDEKLDQR